MIERYTLTCEADSIRKQFGLDATAKYQKIYNGAPTHILPVVTNEHPDGFSFFYWGLPPNMTKNRPVSKKLINAENEQFRTRTSYKNALLSRRCLVPANGIFAWKKISKKGKIPYRYILNDEKPFMMAGIWEEFETENKSGVHTFSIITIQSEDKNPTFAPEIPIILEDEDIEIWLDKKTDEGQLLNLISKTTQSHFGSYPVSSRINKIDLNTPDLIEPSSPMDQFGNYSLFD